MSVDVAVAVAYDSSRESFLLLKRSESMELNPGKWNFPSGKIEDESPKEAVLIELEEETGLIGEIVKKGENFTAESAGKSFNVNPFLVLLNGEVELNKEHSDFRWIKASNLSELDAVDDLERNLDALDIDF